jgi:hypothetical protein
MSQDQRDDVSDDERRNLYVPDGIGADDVVVDPPGCGAEDVGAVTQYWMLALMVGFTSLGLFLLSQSNA